MTALSYLNLRPGATPPPLDDAAPFKAVVVVEAAVTSEWRELVSEWLVKNGCLYMMSWGRDCSLWDDSVDFANLTTFDYGEIPDEAFVMTTWHTEEPLKEVFWFASHEAVHPTTALDRTIIVHVSGDDRSAEFIAAFQRAQNDEV